MLFSCVHLVQAQRAVTISSSADHVMFMIGLWVRGLDIGDRLFTSWITRPRPPSTFCAGLPVSTDSVCVSSVFVPTILRRPVGSGLHSAVGGWSSTYGGGCAEAKINLFGDRRRVKAGCGLSQVMHLLSVGLLTTVHALHVHCAFRWSAD